MNTYSTSKGERITEAKKQRNIRKAKEIKVREFKNDHGFIYCEDCGKSDGYIDISHTVSVKYCQETRRTELAWDQNNLKFRCRHDHNKHDALTNQEREGVFKGLLKD